MKRKQRGALMSADIVYDDRLIESGDPVEQDQYVTSMKRLLDLLTETVHGGHFPSYSGQRHRNIITNWLRKKGA